MKTLSYTVTRMIAQKEPVVETAEPVCGMRVPCLTENRENEKIVQVILNGADNGFVCAVPGLKYVELLPHFI